ncbi:hypothetical protein BDQ17DRAFT_1431351 [Cyathus striatus]|nr:hypothetical protein BDQ17DRAFT_1431351 [Cyathus striatus]
MPVAQTIMDSKAGSLTALEFSGLFAGDRNSRLDINSVPHLKTITLVENLDTSAYPDSISERVLDTAPNNNDISEIIIQVSVWPYSHFFDYHLKKWEDLDELLSEPRFSQLRRVCLTDALPIKRNNTDRCTVPREHIDEFKSVVERYLFRLHRKGLLQITLCNNE